MKRQLDEKARVELFNGAYPVGTEVNYWRGLMEGVPSGSGKTKTPAQLLSGHTAVVWIEGCSGCISLTHVRPVNSIYTRQPTSGARPSADGRRRQTKRARKEIP